jgi:hypothetical protein
VELFDPQHLQEVKLVMPEHNRHGNDAQYQQSKSHFKTQTDIVMEHLEKGEWVTGVDMYEKHRILDVRPRIAAIKKSLIGTGRVLLEEKIKGGHGAKKWAIEDKVRSEIEKIKKAA